MKIIYLIFLSQQFLEQKEQHLNYRILKDLRSWIEIKLLLSAEFSNIFKRNCHLAWKFFIKIILI